jgi:hypothetical protein
MPNHLATHSTLASGIGFQPVMKNKPTTSIPNMHRLAKRQQLPSTLASGIGFQPVMKSPQTATSHKWHSLASLFCLIVFAAVIVVHSPQAQSQEEQKRFDFKVRASQVDSRAKSHPEIEFVLERDGKPTDWEHASVDTRVANQGKLVIWLMGHNGPLFDRLTSYGMNVIQVHYANGWFKRLNREPPPDDLYLGRIRLEAATGEDFSDAIAIPQADGMTTRALMLVKWLAAENPHGHWKQFLTADGNGLEWERVVLSGISHGSTTAARFALHQKVNRVVLFSGPRDQLENWYQLPSATPKDRFFAFTHVLDSGWTKGHYPRSWKMLGLDALGPIVDVDGSAPPFDGSHQLITAADVGDNADRAHNASVPGPAAVRDPTGDYIHEEVWRYLFTH